MSYHENHARSIYKAISYRILSIIIDSVFVYGITGKPKTTLGIVLVTNFYSTFVYYAHERVWNHFHFGKKSLKNEVTKKRTTTRRATTKKATAKPPVPSREVAISHTEPKKRVVRKTTSKKRVAVAAV